MLNICVSKIFPHKRNGSEFIILNSFSHFTMQLVEILANSIFESDKCKKILDEAIYSKELTAIPLKENSF